MVPENFTWVQFPDRINAVFSELLPINELVFQFLIESLHIFLTECQIGKNV